jgi:hypothetical protein
MTPWATLSIASLLAISAGKLDPNLGWANWAPLATAWQVSNPLFLATLALVFMLVAVPVEVRLGRWCLLAAWSLPCLVHVFFWGQAWPELAATSLVAAMLNYSFWRKDRLPWRVWVPLAGALTFTLFLLKAPPLAVAVAILSGALVSWKPASEAVAMVGIAGAAALGFAWLS